MHDFPAPDSWLIHRVSYGETDCMGVMYYAQYFYLFERGRNEYIRARGISYADVERQGYLLPVREAQCRYRTPCRYDDLLNLRTGISELARASLRFVYELWDKDKTSLLASGSTQHAFVSRQGSPVRMPEWLRDILAS